MWYGDLGGVWLCIWWKQIILSLDFKPVGLYADFVGQMLKFSFVAEV